VSDSLRAIVATVGRSGVLASHRWALRINCGFRLALHSRHRLSPRELKQVLVAEGFQVFRVVGSEVVLADRVRDNLIMDSGVAAVCGASYAVRVVARAQASDHPTDSELEMFERVRAVGDAALASGYAETQTAVVPVPDPIDADLCLDTWYEVTYERPDLDLQTLIAELRRALQFRKVA
jgi:hypothetical protein